MVTVTDDESRRIEQQKDSKTKAEVMEVLKEMFGKNIPEATDILVPRWWSNRFYKGSFSNWPIGVNRYEYDQIRVISRWRLVFMRCFSSSKLLIDKWLDNNNDYPRDYNFSSNCSLMMKAPVGRVYFTGEHTSEHYNGYVHGAYLSGLFSLISPIIKNDLYQS